MHKGGDCNIIAVLLLLCIRRKLPVAGSVGVVLFIFRNEWKPLRIGYNREEEHVDWRME